MKPISKRLMVVGLLASMLGGCAVYESMPPGSYAVNADGTRTFTSPGYTCREGYTCTVPAYYQGQQGYYSYEPTYYPYPPTYVAPAPYLWPPLFFGLGYYWGGHHHYRHHPRR